MSAGQTLDAFSMTPDGSILVVGVAEAGTEFVNYWLLDKTGKGLIKGRTDVSGLRIIRNFIFYGMRDEEENVQLYALNRKEPGTKDLKRVLELIANVERRNSYALMKLIL